MPKEAKMPGIRFYISEIELLEEMMSPQEFMDILVGLKDFVKNGRDPELISIRAEPVYFFLKQRVEADIRSYKETCEKNRLNAERRWESEKRKEEQGE